jgi:formate dehydrogenase major subunit
MTNSISEIMENDVMFIIGSNTTENHPVIGAKMRQAIKNGSQLIVADPRRIEIAKDAVIYLPLKPGTNVALINGMMKVIVEEGLIDKAFIDERTESYEAVAEYIMTVDVNEMADICGVDVEDLKSAARLYAKAERGALYYAMGITQHTQGTNNVINIANLAMMTGNVGKEFTGVNPLRGQSNVQGACDLGGLPKDYPGYQKVMLPENKEKFEKHWGVKGLSEKKGLTIPKMMDGIHEGEVRFMYIMGENPMVSDPDLNHVEKAFEKIDFLVVQDIFMTETAEKADVILPAAAFAEKEGTFTNTERRIQRVRKVVEAPGEAKPDWEIFHILMEKMGYKNAFNNAEEIMDEIALVTPIYAGVNYNRLEEEGLQWPVKDLTHPGTRFLHEDEFIRGKGQFIPVAYMAPAEEIDNMYPLILTTGRVLYHYHTRSMTGREEGLNELSPEAFIELSPKTAKEYGVIDGERIKVISRRGHIKVILKVTDAIKDGVAFIPFHFADGAANRLTNTALDDVVDIPELKVAAIKIEKLT